MRRIGLAAAAAIRAGERHGETQQAPVLVFSLVLAIGVLGAAELLGDDRQLAGVWRVIGLDHHRRGPVETCWTRQRPGRRRD